MEITQVAVSFETQIQFRSKNIILRQICCGCLIHVAFSEQITPGFRHMEIPMSRFKWLFNCSTIVWFSVTPAGWASLSSLMHMSRASAQQQNLKPSSEDATESKSFLEGCWHASLGTSGQSWYTGGSQLCLVVTWCPPPQTLLMWQGTFCHTAIVL